MQLVRRRPLAALRGRRETTPPPLPPWPEDNYSEAPAQVVSFLGDEGIDLRGLRVADIGCGDGIMDLGVVQQASPGLLVGFDIDPVDVAGLVARARERGVATDLPQNLRFEQCEAESLPAEDRSFDHVFSWSAFEHVLRPIPVLREIHRVLRPSGLLMIQLWPFFHSKHGSHLWDWFPDGFAQLLWEPGEVERRVRAEPEKGPAWTDHLLAAYRELNRITLDDLQRALLVAGFDVTKLELITETLHIPAELAHLPVSLLGISGVKLLAAPRS